jgi:hypothetical protein
MSLEHVLVSREVLSRQRENWCSLYNKSPLLGQRRWTPQTVPGIPAAEGGRKKAISALGLR